MTSSAPPARASGRGSARAFILGTFVAVFAANVLTGSWEAPATGDGYEELTHFAAEDIPRPQHLLVVPSWRLAHAFVHPLVPGAAPLQTIVLVNALAGAAAVALAAFVGLRLGARPDALAVALGTLAFSHAWWLHSRDPETSMLSNAMLLAASALLLPKGLLSMPRRILSMLAFAFACACSANVITTLPLVVAFEARASNRPLVRLRSFAVAVGFVAPFLGVAALEYATHRASLPRSSFDWALHHSSEDMMGVVQRGPSGLSLIRAGSGFLRCFLPLDGGVPTAAKLALTGRGAEASASASAITAFLASIAIAVTALFLIGRGAVRASSERSAIRAILAGLAGTALGCWLWIGSDPQFWLPILPFVLIGAACSVPRSLWHRATPFFMLIPIGLFLANRPWPTPSIASPKGGAAWISAKTFCTSTREGSLLITMDTPWSFYAAHQCARLRLFRPLHGTPARGASLLEELGRAIDATWASGGRVLLEDFTSDPPPELIGYWENMAVAKGVSREALVEWLRERGDLALLRDAPGGTLRELVPSIRGRAID